MSRLETLGGLALLDSTGARLSTQRRRLALLALLGAAGEAGISRDKLIACLWPESSAANARHALEQLVYELRRQLSDGVIWGGDPLRLNPRLIETDVARFEYTLAHDQPSQAVALYRGPFLDGFYLPHASEFERWVESERARLRARYVDALERLGTAASEAGDHEGARRWWQMLLANDPLSSRGALGLLRSFTAAGHRSEALRYARVYEALVQQELDAAPDPALQAYVRELRAAPAAAEPPTPGEELISPALPATRAMPPPTLGEKAVARRRLLRAVAAPLVLMLLAGVVVQVRRTGAGVAAGRAPPTASRIVILPFRVTGADPSVWYLREGMVDLLATTLTGEGGPPAVDPRTSLAAWRQAGGSAVHELDSERALFMAQRLGAERLLRGEVVGTPARLILSATVLNVQDGRISARAHVQGSADSLPALVEALAGRVLAGEAREAPHRFAAAISVSLPALRAYLDGQRAYRNGRYRDAVTHFEVALDRDSAFALAGLGLALAVGWTPEPADDARGQDIAWALRDRLNAKDRAILEAVRPRYPEPSSARDLIEAREGAVSAAPDRAESWFWLGDELFHQGARMDDLTARDRAAAAFRRSVELDSTVAGPLGHLVELAALSGDTTQARRLGSMFVSADSSGDWADFIRWRVAVAFGDSQSLAALRRRFGVMPLPSLLHMLVTMQFEGVGVDDADLVVAALQRRALRQSDREIVAEVFWNLATNRGRRGEALAAGRAWREARRSADRIYYQRVIGDAVFGDGDSAAAEAAARELTQGAPAGDTGRRARNASFGDVCATTLWDVTRGRLSGAGPAIRLLRSAAVPHDTAGIVEASRLCSYLLDVMLAAAEGRSDVALKLTRLDSLMAAGPVSFSVTWPGAENLVVARLHAERGEAGRGLAAVRRRFHGALHPTRFLASYLLEEGRLAVMAGDTAGAIRGYRHYLALRSNPETALRASAQQVRAHLAILEQASSHRP